MVPPESDLSPLDHFRRGELREAIEVCIAQVKANAGDVDSRFLLGQLLCFAGELDRADGHFGTLASQMPDHKQSLTLVRQLLRAAMARREFFEQGRPPEFAVELPSYVQDCLKAAVCLRQGDVSQAQSLLRGSEEARPAFPGSCDGERFEDFRDSDDVLSCALEVFTGTGKYLWIPLERVRHIRLDEVVTPLDVLWRPGRLDVAGGPQGIAYFPAIYPGTHASRDESLQVGLAAEWRDGGGELSLGVGGRNFWVGPTLCPMVNMHELRFDSAGEAGG